MKDSRIFDASVCLMVVAAHVIGLLLMTARTQAHLEIGMAGFEVVNLGDLSLGGQAQVQEEVKKKAPVEPPKPKPKKMIAVKDKTKPADIIEKPKEIIPPEPKKEEEVQKTEGKSDKNVEGSATAGRGGSGTSQTGAAEGSGQGSTQATHLGGHLQNPKPPYPPISQENGEQGKVGLKVVVEPNGYPSSVELMRSSGYSRLDRSALKTVKGKYKFRPATRMGVPIQSVYTFSIEFKLDN